MTIDPNTTENICVEKDLCEQNLNVVTECPRYADMVHGVADDPEEVSSLHLMEHLTCQNLGI